MTAAVIIIEICEVLVMIVIRMQNAGVSVRVVNVFFGRKGGQFSACALLSPLGVLSAPLGILFGEREKALTFSNFFFLTVIQATCRGGGLELEPLVRAHPWSTRLSGLALELLSTLQGYGA